MIADEVIAASRRLCCNERLSDQSERFAPDVLPRTDPGWGPGAAMDRIAERTDRPSCFPSHVSELHMPGRRRIHGTHGPADREVLAPCSTAQSRGT